MINAYGARTMGTGDRLAVDEEENLIPELGVRLKRQGAPSRIVTLPPKTRHYPDSGWCYDASRLREF